MAAKKCKPLDPRLAHELLDRSYVIACMIDTLLRQHPAAQHCPALGASLTRLEDAASAFYQAAAALEG
jgi:hypothetical protein